MENTQRYFAIFTKNKDLICILVQQDKYDAVPVEALTILRDKKCSQLNIPDSLYDIVNISLVDVVSTQNLESFLLRNVA